MENAETFSVALDATNALVTDTDTATGTITDNDAATVTVEDVTAEEGVGLVFTVTWTRRCEGAFNVDTSSADVGHAPRHAEDYDNE